MIVLSRLNGHAFALNPDLLERAEATPDTVLTMADGSKLVVAESVEEVVDRVRTYRASVIVRAHQLEHDTDDDAEHDAPERPLVVVPLPSREG
jgi:flagellar protein FlbD